jgi:hypothetical protein
MTNIESLFTHNGGSDSRLRKDFDQEKGMVFLFPGLVLLQPFI